MTRTTIEPLRLRRAASALLLFSLSVGTAACDLAVDGDDVDAIDVQSATQAASSAPPVLPEMRWLADLPAEADGELVLARLFANGTADYVPVGSSTGYPVLFSNATGLNEFASQLWGGKTLRAVEGEYHDNGDPVVFLDNKIIKTGDGAVIDLFDAEVTRAIVPDMLIGANRRGETIPAPTGELDPVGVSFLSESVVIDDSPSIVLNYVEDRSLPVIRRILDEIREIDAEACPGLFLGRAHVRRCTSFSCGELPSPLVDFPERPGFATSYEWAFWTYFLLNFGQGDASCTIDGAVDAVAVELADEGVDLFLPPLPNQR